MTHLLYEALKAKYHAEMVEAKAILEVYFTNPVGVGEHSDLLKELDVQLCRYQDAKGKLDSLSEVVLIIPSGQEEGA